MVRALFITTLIEALPAALASISPDHVSKWYPAEGTAVNITTAPLEYVPAAHSGGSYVKLPPFSGTLTTVSLYTPQAQTLAGVATDITNAAHATRMATRQSIRNHLFNIMSFTSPNISFFVNCTLSKIGWYQRNGILGAFFNTLALAVALRPLDLHRLAVIYAKEAFHACLHAKAAAVAFLFIDFDYLLHCLHQHTGAKPSYAA
jgi:hypothetical protein